MPHMKTARFPHFGVVLQLSNALAITIGCSAGCLFAADTPAASAGAVLPASQINTAPGDTLSAPPTPTQKHEAASTHAAQSDTTPGDVAPDTPKVELPRYAQIPLKWDTLENSGLRPGIACTYDRDTRSFKFEHVSLQDGRQVDSASAFTGKAAQPSMEAETVASEPATSTTWYICIDVSDSSRNTAVKEQISASCELIPLLPQDDRVLVYALGQSLQPWGAADSASSRKYLVDTLAGYAKTKNFGLGSAIRGESLIFFRLRDIVNTSGGNAHILLLSDGCDESLDSESLKQELIKAARNKGIGISGIAYAGGKETGSKGFNNVQDLASATWGLYTEATPDNFIVPDLHSFVGRLAAAGHPARYTFSLRYPGIPKDSIKVLLKKDGAPVGCVFLPESEVSEAVLKTTVVKPEEPEEPATPTGKEADENKDTVQEDADKAQENKAEPDSPVVKPEETVTIGSWTLSRQKFNIALYTAGGLLLSLILLILLLLVLRRKRARRAAPPKDSSSDAYGMQEQAIDSDNMGMDRNMAFSPTETPGISGRTMPISFGGGTRPMFDSVPLPQVSLNVSEVSDGSSIIVSIGGKSRSYPITKDTVLIGSDFSSDLVLQDQTVSKSHCVLKKDSNGKWHLTDLGSTNKLYFAGRLHDALVINNGDTVELGNALLQFNLK